MATEHLIIVRQHFTSNLQISSNFLNLINGGIFNSFKSLNSKIFGDIILWFEVVAGYRYVVLKLT